MDEKKWYKVVLSAEDSSSGWVKLTKEEALAVGYACNMKNWKKKNLNPWSGCFYIDLEHPREHI